MRELTRHGHLSLAIESTGPFRVRNIYPRDPLVRRRMHDHLTDIAMRGILDRTSRNEGASWGQYYEYDFAVDLGSW